MSFHFQPDNFKSDFFCFHFSSYEMCDKIFDQKDRKVQLNVDLFRRECGHSMDNAMDIWQMKWYDMYMTNVMELW